MSRRQSKSKDQWIYGIHAVTAAVHAKPEKITRLCIAENRKDQKIMDLLDLVRANKIYCELVSREEITNYAGDVNHQGVAAIYVGSTVLSDNDLFNIIAALNEPPFLLILDHIQDPHNLGACLRSAEAAGVHAVITTKDNSVGLTAAVRKVAAGSAERVPFVQVVNLARLMEQLKKMDIWLVGLDGKADKTIYGFNLTGSLAIVMGSEENGMRRLTREYCDALVKIPMEGLIESLNLSVATSISLFEAVRQRP